VKTIITICIAFISTFAYASDIETIASAIENGNSITLSSFFGENVEIKLIDTENVYSKSQASLVLKSFFEKNKPEKFTISHQGGQESARFAIGTLVTENGNFRLQFFMKKNGNKLYIQKFTVEKA